MEKILKCALAFALISCFLFVSSANTKTADGQTEVHKDGKNDTEVTKPLVSGDLEGNCTANGTNKCPSEGNVFQRIWENREMLMRTMYVLFAVTGIVVLYFVVRAFRLHKRRSKSRKYGVITTRGDLEMEPLGQGGDDEEDYTVFEVNGKHK